MAPENRPAEQEPVANGVASMGPGPDGPGKLESEYPEMWEEKCFNGAGAGWPRKTPYDLLSGDYTGMLQWGRGRMAPENWRLATLPRR